MAKIKSITRRHYTGKVHDLTVKDLHAYNIEGLSVHNSAVGSLTLYVLGVTQLDPIKYGLLFERFLNPDRVSPPDVDVDFEYTRRQEVVDYIIRKYGEDRCCKIGTYQKMKARSIVHEVVKVLDLGKDWEAMEAMRKNNPFRTPESPKKSIELSNIISKQIPEDENGVSPTIDESYADCPEFRAHVDSHSGLLDILRNMEKVIKSSGIHASGYIVSKNPVVDHVPMKIVIDKKTKNEVVCCQFEGPDVEELGLLKFDLLGLKNLTIVDKSLKMIKERYNKDVDIEHLEPNDKKVLELFNGTYKGIDNRGIFQFESYGISKLLKEIHVSTFKDLAVGNALFRPGPLGAGIHTMYANFKNGRAPIEALHPRMLEILKDTYGLMIFQESLMKISVELAGFTKGQSDTLRKCITGDTMFVSKTRGWITVDRLLVDGYKNDLFLNMDNNGKQEWVKLEDIWSTGQHRVLRVETKSGLYVDTTQYHQILTNDGWKARMRLSNDDFIVTANKISYDGTDNISSDLAFIIAGLLTEGYFVEDQSTFVNYDVEIMDMFCDSFEREFGKRPHITNNTIAYIPLEERLRIAKIMDYGLAGDKYIPDVMMGMSLESTRKFLSFMLTLEGGFSKSTHQFEFSSKSKRMTSQVKLLLLRFGITGLILEKHIKNNPNTYYRLYVNDADDQKKMLQELTCCMQQYKIEELNHCLTRQTNRTTDIFPPNIVKQLLNQYPYIGNKQSGTLYNSNISRKRMNDIVKKANDQEWIRLVNGEHRYDKLKKATDLISKSITTYDFTVESGKYPSIIANGIVIHNCIGKKKPELIAKEQLDTKFIDGCKKNGISENIARAIFKQIEFFGGYGFNLSHSAAYAMQAYQNAYLKLYYPIEFMTNLLSINLDNEDKIDNYLKQALDMGIVVKLVDINKSDIEFTIEKAYSKNQNKEIDVIRTPLTALKGVGDKAVESIIANRPFKTLKEFMTKVDTSKVNIQVFKALLDAGSMYCFADRNKYVGVSREEAAEMARNDIMAEYEILREEIEKAKNYEKNLERKLKKEQDKIDETFGGGSLFDKLGESVFTI